MFRYMRVKLLFRGTDGTVQRIRIQLEDGLQISISGRRLHSQRVKSVTITNANNNEWRVITHQSQWTSTG